MRTLFLVSLVLAGLVPLMPAGASHCGASSVVITDDGTHHGDLDVRVNGVGVAVVCGGFVVGTYEHAGTTMVCRVTRVTDDGFQGAAHSGGTVHVNGAGVDHMCIARVIVPENFYLP